MQERRNVSSVIILGRLARRSGGNTEGVTLDVVIGVVHFAVAIVLLVSVRRAASRFPWLLALAAFFAVRGVDRLINAVEDPPALVGLLADLCVAVTLVLLLVGLPRTLTALRSAYDDAQQQTESYSRALRDYRALVRHRLANPLAALRGGVQGLRELELTAAEQRRLLAMLHEQVLRLEQLSLEPQPNGAEERALRATPAGGARAIAPERLEMRPHGQRLRIS